MGRVHVCLMGPGTDRSSLTAGAVCRETSGGGGLWPIPGRPVKDFQHP